MAALSKLCVDAYFAAMLTEIYIEALLVDEELADQVWEMWNAGVITDDLAAWAWCILASIRNDKCQHLMNHAPVNFPKACNS